MSHGGLPTLVDVGAPGDRAADKGYSLGMSTGPGQLGEQPKRLSLGRSVAIGVVLGAVLLIAVVVGVHWWETTGRWSSTPIQSINQSGDDGEYELTIGCEVGDARASVLEFDDRVMVSVEITGSASQLTCATILYVTLADPIGDRSVIDEATGDDIKALDRG